LLPESADPMRNITEVYTQVPHAQAPASYAYTRGNTNHGYAHTRDTAISGSSNCSIAAAAGSSPLAASSVVAPSAPPAAPLLVHYGSTSTSPLAHGVSPMLYGLSTVYSASPTAHGAFPSGYGAPQLSYGAYSSMPHLGVTPAPAYAQAQAPPTVTSAAYGAPAVNTVAPSYGALSAIRVASSLGETQLPAPPPQHVQACCHSCGAQQPCQLCGLNGRIASQCLYTDIGNNCNGRR
jgi:hypothetical protein